MVLKMLLICTIKQIFLDNFGHLLFQVSLTGWILEANFRATEIEILKESGDTDIVRIKG